MLISFRFIVLNKLVSLVSKHVKTHPVYIHVGTELIGLVHVCHPLPAVLKYKFLQKPVQRLTTFPFFDVEKRFN